MRKLKAGVGVACITPPNGIEMGAWVLRQGLSQGVHDDLYARAVVLDDGCTPIAIVGLDVAAVSDAMTNRVRDLVVSHVPIPATNILLNCSHTHTSPYTYVERSGLSSAMDLSPGQLAYLGAFPHYVAGAIIEAWYHREDAGIGAGSIPVRDVTVNRRDPSLPVDPQLGVIRVDGADGRSMACLVNYACHATAVGAHYLEWTADFPGYLSRSIELAEPSCTCIFLQGASGDIHPWDWYFGNPQPRFGDTYEAAERLGLALSGPTLGLLQQIATDRATEIRRASSVVSLPPRPLSWSAGEAEAYLAQLEATISPYQGEVIPDGCPGCMSAQRYPDLYRLFGARHEAALARHYPSAIEAELNAVRINDIVLATNPGEPFCELGMGIKAQSPYENTFVLSLTNGSIMYLPTRDAAEAVLGLPLEEFTDPVKYRQHYGATITTDVAPPAGEMVVEETIRLIGQTVG